MMIRFSLLIFPVFFSLACCKGQSCCENAYTMFIKTGSTMNLDTSCLDKEEREAAVIGQAALERRAKCLLMLSYNDLNNNRFENSLQRLEVLKSSLNPSDAAHKQYLADLYNLQAYIYNQQSYQSLAEASYKEAITLYKELGMRDGRLVNEANLVKLLAEQGKFSEAVDLGTRVCEETKSLFSFFRSGELKGTAANNLAFAYSLQSQSYRADMRTVEMRGSAEKALEIFKKNVDIASGIGGNPYRVTLLNASNAAVLAEQYDVSRNFIQQYFDGPWKYPNMLNCANFSSSAVLHARTGNFEAALSDLINSCRPLGLAASDDSLATPDVKLPSGDTIQLVITILQNKGAVLHLHYNKHHQIEYLEKSLAAYEQAAKIFNELQNELLDEASVVAQRLRFHSVYPNAARIAALLYQETPLSEAKKKDEYWRKAFKYAEQGQGFVLRQNIRAAFEAECNDSSAAEPRCREKALRDKLFQYRKSGAQSSVLATLDEYQKFFNALKTSSNPADVQYYNQRFNHDVPSLEDVQQDLLPDHRAVFIEYVWSAPQPFALWITKQSKGLVFLDIPSGDKFWSDVSLFRKNWLQNEGSLDKGLGQMLYQTLLGKVLNDIPVKQRGTLDTLVIAADNVLRTIPFEALLMKGQNDINKYVVEEYVVGYQYSVALWHLQQKQALKIRGGNFSIGSFADTTNRNNCGKQVISRLSHFSTQTLGNMARNAEVFSPAKIADFKEVARRFDLLHFCMHGCLDDDPEQSYLSFAVSDAGSRLSALDLYAMRLKARLAVFASCNTARQRGDHEVGHKGEGIIGLHRAFNYAGCPNIIATMNEVSDRPSSVLLEYFYQYLFKGLPADRALTQAKRDYLKDPNEVPHPSYWANFICIGPPAQFKK
ncbi:MAG: CHAT domain-containing protein [Saprospiraceae bacterium]|nr:CHAT domain-containing protein [Saprospiraceae bacterium]